MDNLNKQVDKLDNIVRFHNKNLTKKQYFALEELREFLCSVITKSTNVDGIIEKIVKEWNEQETALKKQGDAPDAYDKACLAMVVIVNELGL